MEAQRPQISKAILSKKQCCRYHKTKLQTILQSHSNKNSIELALKKRPEDQQKTREGPDTNLHNYSHLIFDKEA
jgi:hypothetical protein